MGKPKVPGKKKAEKGTVKKGNLNAITSYFLPSKILRTQGFKDAKIKCVDSNGLPKFKEEDDNKKYDVPSTSSSQTNQELCNESQAEEEPLSVLGDLLGTVIPNQKKVDEKIPVPAFLNSHHLVALGVETTGLDLDCHIIQITCSNVNSEREDFNCFIQPEKQIHPEATEVNEMTFELEILRKNGVEVKNPHRLREGLENLIGYLQENTILISHNSKQFQARRLVRNVQKTNLMERFTEKVIGFCDSYSLFTQLFPRWQNELNSYKLQDLIIHFSQNFERDFERPVPGQVNMIKIKNLVRLLRFHGLTDEGTVHRLYDHSMSLEFFVNLHSFDDPCKQGCLSKLIAKKMASSGLKLEHLEIAHRTAEMKGVFELLIPRVTKSASVLNKLWRYFNQPNS